MAKVKNPLLATPKRHPLRWLGLFLLFIIAAVALPVGFVAALFLDTTHYNTGIETTTEVDATKVFQQVMGDMFDNCRSELDPSIDLNIREMSLNALLYSIANTQMKNIPVLGNFYRQLDFEIYKDEYIFGLELQIWEFVKTKVYVILNLKSDVELYPETEPGVNGFEFLLKDIKVGRLGGMTDTLSGMGFGLGNLISMMSLPLSIKADPNNANRLTYSYNDFANDLSNISGMGEGMFMELFKTFFDNDTMTFGHNYEGEKDITGTVSLKPFIKNDKYYFEGFRLPQVGGIVNKTYLTEKSELVQDMINRGYIVNDNPLGSRDNLASAMHQYLCFGGDFLTSAEAEYIEAFFADTTKCSRYLDGKSYSEYTTYAEEYYFGPESSNIMNTLMDDAKDHALEVAGSADAPASEKITLLQNIKNSLDANNVYYLFGGDNGIGGAHDYAPDLIIYDSDLHDMMKNNTQLMGYGYPFITEKDDGTYKYSYTMLDNLYATTIAKDSTNPDSKEEFALTFGLNINQTETSLVLACPEEEFVVPDVVGTHSYTPEEKEYVFGKRFSVTDASMFYGEVQMDNLKAQLGDLMSGVDKVSEWFTFEKVDGQLTAMQMYFDMNDLIIVNPSDPSDEGNEDFTNFHNNMIATTQDIPNKIFVPMNSTLFVNIVIKDNPTNDVDHGKGRIEIQIGYRKNS